MDEYAALNILAEGVADVTCTAINAGVRLVDQPSIPYKQQYVLEEVIKILQKRV